MTKPTIPEVLPLVRDYCAKHGGGGISLHVVLDDCNVEDVFVEGAIEDAQERRDEDAEAIAKLLLRMSKTQRRKIAAKSHLARR